MSVSFTIDAVAVAFAVECVTDGERRDQRTWAHDDEGYHACYEAADLHACGCGGEGCLVTVYDIDTHEVNLSRDNAAAVLGRLGLSVEDPWGHLDAEDFLGRVLVMNVGEDDEGVAPSTTRVGMFGAGPTYVDCGQRPGYFTDVEVRLATLATEAVRLGRQVVWS